MAGPSVVVVSNVKFYATMDIYNCNGEKKNKAVERNLAHLIPRAITKLKMNEIIHVDSANLSPPENAIVPSLALAVA